MIAAQKVSILDFTGQTRSEMETAASAADKVGGRADARTEKISDHALLIASREGDDAAFETLVNRYRNQITNFIFRMLGDYDESVDLAQETFVRIFKARDRYTDAFAFSTYIYRIAANLAISELRRRKRRRLVSLNFLMSAADETIVEFQPPDDKPLPDAVFADRQIAAIVQSAINTLPEKYRAPVILRDVEGKTYEEIAQILATNEGTIKSRISRGRNLLREKLKNYF